MGYSILLVAAKECIHTRKDDILWRTGYNHDKEGCQNKTEE